MIEFRMIITDKDDVIMKVFNARSKQELIDKFIEREKYLDETFPKRNKPGFKEVFIEKIYTEMITNEIKEVIK